MNHEKFGISRTAALALRRQFISNENLSKYSLDEFCDLSLRAMQGVAADLGL